MDQESPGIDERIGLIEGLTGDGRPLLAVMTLCLMLSGAFAIFQSATGHFLPHDVQYLGMDKEKLCGLNQCRIVHFMFHDRVSFGGSLLAIGCLYLWLLAFPMSRRESWAWWVFLVSGVSGFGSFLAYLGYGYLDTWHGIATLFLLVPYIGGMAQCFKTHRVDRAPTVLLIPGARLHWTTSAGIGRLLLLATGAGMMAGGASITVIGMTAVFVPQDLRFMGLTAQELQAVNPKLIPLIAHDRAGFGGGLFTAGLTWLFCVWCGRPSKSLWQALLLAGVVGFACAIGVHPLIRYNDFTHLLPAYAGAVLFIGGIALQIPKSKSRIPK